jgi:S-(hydroxymethyl)glutathione dehydrogenase/alcohol dehydrogenase
MSGQISVRAAVLDRMGEPVRVEELRLDAPRAGEVLVRVAAAGVCHSDLHLADGHLGTDRQPIVLGHEGSGVVEQIGAGVTTVAAGDRVALCFVPACGSCPRCLAGQTNLCHAAAASTSAGELPAGGTRLHRVDGSDVKHFLNLACFAERCVVDARSIVPVPDDLPLWEAALVGCSVMTGVGAVRNAAGVKVGDTVAVIGCGGVGVQAVSAASLAGASRVIAIDLDPAKLELARSHGATDVVQASDRAVHDVRALTGGGADHAIEVVGRPETMRLAWDAIRPGGMVVVVGLAPAGVEVSLPAIEFLSDKGIRGSYYGSGDPAADLPALAALALDGRIDLAGVVTNVSVLDGVNDALDRLRHGAGARSILVLDESAAGISARPA